MILTCRKCGITKIDVWGASENTTYSCPKCNPSKKVFKSRDLWGRTTGSIQQMDLKEHVHLTVKQIRRIEAYEAELWRYTHVAGIPDKEMRAAFLNYHGWPLRDIAKDLGVSHVTAAAMIKGAAASNKKLWEKYGHRYGRKEMIREELNLGPDHDRMADRWRRDRRDDDGVRSRGKRKPSMSEQEEK